LRVARASSAGATVQAPVSVRTSPPRSLSRVSSRSARPGRPALRAVSQSTRTGVGSPDSVVRSQIRTADVDQGASST